MPERGGAAAEVCFLSATLHFTARRPSFPSRPCPLCELPLPSWSLRTCAVGLRVAPTLRLQSARSLPGRLMACPAFTEKIHSQPETVTSFGQWVNRKISCSSLRALRFTHVLCFYLFCCCFFSAVNFLSESTGACTRLLYRGRQPVMQSQPQTD